MKKKLTPPTTEVRKAYVLLPDGTPARRLKPTVQNGNRYWNLALGADGTTKRVPQSKVADYCELLDGVDYPSNPNA